MFRARETVYMPSPGDSRAASFNLRVQDLVWDFVYVPIARSVSFLADRLNYFQFLTIRRYLSLVFLALVSLLLILAIWS